MTHTYECSTEVRKGDLDAAFLNAAIAAGRVAWDIETSGLNWSTDQIGTCQVAMDDRVAIVVLDKTSNPTLLQNMLARPDVQKVFHHAPFDLRFMTHQWNVSPANVACTKVASKILDPSLENRQHSLMPVLQRHLGVTISKDQQVSDWLAETLTQDQLDYAAGDVRHLLPLYDVLRSKLEEIGRLDDLTAANLYLPARVRAEQRGLGDVFAY